MRFALVLLYAVALTPAAALADAAAAKEKATTVCAACHGADGNSTNPLWPRLAGQNARYIYLQLKDFKEGRRKDPLMSPMAANLSREDMLDLADYFASQKPWLSTYPALSFRVQRFLSRPIQGRRNPVSSPRSLQESPECY